MIDSTVVLNGQAIAYTAYAIAVLLFMAWFAIKITSKGKAGVLKANLFLVLVIILIILGVSLHITTSSTIPWVTIDLNRGDYTPNQVVNITVANHEFNMDKESYTAKVGDLVLFDVVSNDVTYGFGVFRDDNTMVCQMQVVPGHRNDLLWKFEKPGTYTFRSTEYSGPKGHRMIYKDILKITE